MTGVLDLDRVDELRVRLSYGHLLEGPAHDVFLLDLRLAPSAGRFEERPYLDALAPVLRSPGGDWAPTVVHVNRTHSNWAGESGVVEIAVALATGRYNTLARDAVDKIHSAFRSMLDGSGDAAAPTSLDHEQALLEARWRVERGYGDVHADLLAVTDEEHVPASGMWSVGLVLADRARFSVRIGFVDGDVRSTHVQRRPGSEVVDSLGTGNVS